MRGTGKMKRAPTEEEKAKYFLLFLSASLPSQNYKGKNKETKEIFDVTKAREKEKEEKLRNNSSCCYNCHRERLN